MIEKEVTDMEQKKRWFNIVLVLILLAAAGLCGFYYGKTAEAQQYQKEKEYAVQLNRSELEGLGEIEGKIYITGHRSPDTDTVAGAISCAYLLQQLGYDAVPVILTPINHETAFVLEHAGLEVPQLLEDASGLNMILVDHSEYAQSAEGLKDARILAIIDHHGDGSVSTGNPLIYDARPIGSTATIMWMRYRNYGIEPDQKTAAVMMSAILSDTYYFKSETTTFADREAVKELSRLAGITDLDTYYQEMYKASISYDGMNDTEVFFSDYKEYESGSTNFGIACLNAYDDQSAQELIRRMQNTLPDIIARTGMDMIFVMISIFHDDVSVTYLLPGNEAAREVLETAFTDKAEFDGTAYKLEPGIARKKGLVPPVTDILASYPQE